MNIQESDELNREIRKILKGLNVEWKDGGHMLRTSNEIINQCNHAVRYELDKNKMIIDEIKEMVN